MSSFIILKFANEKQTQVHENNAEQFALDFDARRANGARSHSGRRGRMSRSGWRRGWWSCWRMRWRRCRRARHDWGERDYWRDGGLHTRAVLDFAVQARATLVLFSWLYVGAERERDGKVGVLFVDVGASERLIDAFAVRTEPFDFVERRR